MSCNNETFERFLYPVFEKYANDILLQPSGCRNEGRIRDMRMFFKPEREHLHREEWKYSRRRAK